jgi:threonine dehydrogenase-like Zn-dependent dehydrogenase
MLAGVYSGPGKIECREVPTPEPGRNEALIKVRAAAVCGTDLRMFKSGHFAIREGQERILGHEFSGEIAEVGPGVTRYEPGMKVSVASNIGCGACRMCRMGKVHMCPEYIAIGITLEGGFAEYFKMHDKPLLQGNLIPLGAGGSSAGGASKAGAGAAGDGFDFAAIALAEPLSCCVNAWESVRTQPGDTVLIVGAGPMGALHTQVNRLAGAKTIIVADLLDSRLALMGKFGPDALVNTEKEDLKAVVMQKTGGEGADVVITACPAPSIQKLAVEVAARFGRINLFGGLPKGKERVELDTNLIHYRQITVTGTTGASLAHHALAVDLITSGKVDAKSVVSRRFRITEVRKAFEYAMSGEGLKTIIEF